MAHPLFLGFFSCFSQALTSDSFFGSWLGLRNLLSTSTSNVKFPSLVSVTIAVTAGAWSIKCIEFASPFSPRKGLAASTSTHWTEDGWCRKSSDAMDMSFFNRFFFSSSTLGYWPRCGKLKFVLGFFWPLFALGECSDCFNSSATVSSPASSLPHSKSVYLVVRFFEKHVLLPILSPQPKISQKWTFCIKNCFNC